MHSISAACAVPGTPISCTQTSPEQGDLERNFVKAFKLACSTTGLGQTFYRPEFDRADSLLTHAQALLDSTDQAMQTGTEDLDGVFHKLAAFTEELKQTASHGLRFRLWRDGISLVTSVMLLGSVVSALLSKEQRRDDDFSAANNPFGALAGDVGLVLLEGGKMLVTTSLSYATLKRHHMTDEFIKRMTVSITLLKACLEDQRGSASVVASPLQRGVLQCMEKGRDISTVFTLLNTTLSSVRGVLLGIELMGSSAGPASWRGLLRLVQNASDSLRAVFSTIGTAARTKLFSLELEQCQTALPVLRQQLHIGNAAHVLPQLKKMALLFSVCSTPLLTRIAASSTLITAFKNTELASLDGVQNFLEQAQIPFVVDGDGQFLHAQAPENRWGERLVKGVHQSALSQVLRAPYRLALEAQYQMSKPSEAMASVGVRNRC